MEFDWGEIFRIAVKTQAAQGLGLLLLWGAIGLAAGLALVWPVYRLLRRAGAFELSWRRAGWMRGLAVLWLVAAFGLLGGAAGALQGGLYGAQRVIERSQFRSEVLEQAGAATAHGLAALDLVLQEAPSDRMREELAAFEGGTECFDATGFLQRLGTAEEKVLQPAIQRGLDQARTHFALAKGGATERLLEWSLRHLPQRVLRKKLGSTELFRGMERVLDGLPAVARRAGNPQRATRAELTRHIVEQGMVPAITSPLRGYVRAKQALCVVLLAGSVLLLAAAFWLGRALERRRADAAPAVA